MDDDEPEYSHEPLEPALAVHDSGRVSVQELLLFDEIFIPGLNRLIGQLWNSNPEEAAKLDYLAQLNVVRHASLWNIGDSRTAVFAIPHPVQMSCWFDDTAIGRQARQELEHTLQRDVPEASEDAWHIWKNSRSPYNIIYSYELSALALRFELGRDLVRVFADRPVGVHTSVSIGEPRTSQKDPRRGPPAVADIVIAAMPQPCTDTALEQILELRADPTLRESLKDLRLWMRRTALRTTNRRELEVELDSLLHDYETAMRVHRLSYNHKRWRALVKIPLGFVENIVRLRLTSAVDALFSVQAGRIALAEAELAANGREVAYISHLKNLLDESHP